VTAAAAGSPLAALDELLLLLLWMCGCSTLVLPLPPPSLLLPKSMGAAPFSSSLLGIPPIDYNNSQPLLLRQWHNPPEDGVWW
jgi:hypothetical protein